ncbi:lectin-like [Tripterygium wilfordii]|uniref:lectin-like n=1 Tax=Tripterygium wilfordii TaxID=458696 RepID=UPI0018F832E8|nr:lectin-like [Tripterygium wilfordii]
MNAKLVMNQAKIPTTMHILLVLFLAAVAFLNQAYAERLAPEPAPQLSATNFAFPAFDTQSCSSSSNLLCLGAVTAHDGFLSLEPEPSPYAGFQVLNKGGRVQYRHPVGAWLAFFSTTFTYRIVGVSNSPSILSFDGITFIMAPDDRTGVNLGTVGQVNTDAASDIRLITVELYTQKNDFDIDGNYITLRTNVFGIDLKSGKVIKVRIDYNSWRKWLEVYAAFESDPLDKVFSTQIDIAATFPNSMYVGFTAATGYFTESYQLLSWEFKSSTKWNQTNKE